MKRSTIVLSTLFAVLIAGATVATSLQADSGKLLATSLQADSGKLLARDRYVGLDDVNSNRLTHLHKAPGVDFTAYATVLIEPTSVDFAAHWLREQHRQGNYLRAEDVERVSAGLVDAADAFFADYFAAQGYRVVDRADESTLRVTPRLVNVNISVPDAGRNKYSQVYGNYGFVTLDIDFADALSQQLLASVRDEKRPRGPQFAQRNVSTNEQALQYLLAEWGEALDAELTLAAGRVES